jgi:uncharacterized membrane protein YdjX (TVP38/TMEM64 family)
VSGDGLVPASPAPRAQDEASEGPEPGARHDDASPGPIARLLAWATLAGAVAWVVLSYVQGGIVGVMLDPELAAAAKLAYLRAHFAALGPLAPLAYVVIVTIEVVVAPIPGTILYAPAGVIFGGFWGGVLSLAGNVIGAALAFALMRALGRAAFERWLEREHLERLERRLIDNGLLVVFLLRINPLTSSDILSYAAGATSMPLRTLLLGTTLGLAPLCFLQAYLAEGLLAAFPWLIYPLLVTGIAYAVLFVWVLRRALRPEARRHRQDG